MGFSHLLPLFIFISSPGSQAWSIVAPVGSTWCPQFRCGPKARFRQNSKAQTWTIATKKEMPVRTSRKRIMEKSDFLPPLFCIPTQNFTGHLRNRLRTEVPIPYMFGLFLRPKFQGISPGNMAKHMVLPSGNLTVCYWKWPSRNSGFAHW